MHRDESRNCSSILEYLLVPCLQSLHGSLMCLLEQVHLDYLEAGADIIITASYQVIYCPIASLSLSL